MRIGFNGRFFPGNWRPPADEARFAAEHGFAAVQIRNDRPGALADEIRADPAVAGKAFADRGLECVLEMLVRFNEPITAREALERNLAAIGALGARRVHIHPVPGAPDVDVAALEASLPEQFADAFELAEREGLLLGVEHNARAHRLLIEPTSCLHLLEAVPGLGFVWDLNHMEPEQIDGYAALKPRLTLVHASDTPLPETNHHLPLGEGTVDVSAVAGVDVPVILEIGGQPVSGGYGKDTDDALIASRNVLSRFG